MKELIRNSRLSQRYGVRRETIYKWKRDPRVNFPKPAAISNGIEYFDPDELDEYDQASLAKRNAERRNIETA
jgi:predicted DNA-binding transcriptional regulator AlpA